MARRARIDAIHQQRACYWYEAFIAYQRPLLSALFYAALNAGTEADDILERLLPLQDQFKRSPTIWSVEGIDARDDYNQKLDTEDQHRAASMAGAYAASCLFLLTDRMITKFNTEIRFNVMNFGAKIGTVAFPSAARAFADQARHIHEWQNKRATTGQTAAAKTIARLGLEPKEDASALGFLRRLNLKSYLGYEAHLFKILDAARAEIKRRLDDV